MKSFSLTDKSDALYKAWEDSEHQPNRSLEGKHIITCCEVWIVRYSSNITGRVDYVNY